MTIHGNIYTIMNRLRNNNINVNMLTVVIVVVSININNAIGPLIINNVIYAIANQHQNNIPVAIATIICCAFPILIIIRSTAIIATTYCGAQPYDDDDGEDGDDDDDDDDVDDIMLIMLMRIMRWMVTRTKRKANTMVVLIMSVV